MAKVNSGSWFNLFSAKSDQGPSHQVLDRSRMKAKKVERNRAQRKATTLHHNYLHAHGRASNSYHKGSSGTVHAGQSRWK
jgi:hypothetical protein